MPEGEVVRGFDLVAKVVSEQLGWKGVTDAKEVWGPLCMWDAKVKKGKSVDAELKVGE